MQLPLKPQLCNSHIMVTTATLDMVLLIGTLLKDKLPSLLSSNKLLSTTNSSNSTTNSKA
jgi:hypothetical protein